MLTATLTSILTTVRRSVNGPAIRTDVPKYHNIHPMCNVTTSHSRMSSSNLTRVLSQYVFSVWGNAFLKSTEINAAIALRGCRILSTTPSLHGCMFSELKQIWRFIPYWTSVVSFAQSAFFQGWTHVFEGTTMKPVLDVSTAV